MWRCGGGNPEKRRQKGNKHLHTRTRTHTHTGGRGQASRPTKHDLVSFWNMISKCQNWTADTVNKSHYSRPLTRPISLLRASADGVRAAHGPAPPAGVCERVTESVSASGTLLSRPVLFCPVLSCPVPSALAPLVPPARLAVHAHSDRPAARLSRLN